MCDDCQEDGNVRMDPYGYHIRTENDYKILYEGTNIMKGDGLKHGKKHQVTRRILS